MNILDFGAIGDGKTLNTAAIQQAIDTCHSRGGGQVVIPAGNFVSGTIYLKSNVELHFEHNAHLIASTNMDDYNALDAYPQNWGSDGEEWVGKHLILSVEETNIAITGHGIIDGNADFFFEEPPAPKKNYGWIYGIAKSKDKKLLRPGQMICLIECTHIRISDITIINSTCWSCFLHGCEYAQIRGVMIFNKPFHANTDGIDIDTCRYVTVSDCIIDTGDDAFAIRCSAKRLKSKNDRCAYITITNCVLSSTISGFRIGVGTGEICHVTVSNITINRAARGIQFITAYSFKGCALIHDMNFSNITAENISFPITLMEMNQGYIRNITIQNFRAHAFCACKIQAEDAHSISNINIRDVEITIKKALHKLNEDEAEERGVYALDCNNAEDLHFENVRINIPEELQELWEGVYRAENCTNVHVSNCSFPV